MLSEMISGGKGQDAAARAGKIHQLAQDLSTLIDEVGELARLDGGRGRFTFENIRSHALAGDIQRTLAVTIPASRPVIMSVAAEIPPVVRTDPTRLRQVLDALASTMVEGDGQAIPVRLETDDSSMLAIRLLDTVEASPTDDLEGLFKPFCSPSKRTSRAHGGQSLKLAVAHRIAVLLGGSACPSP